MAFSAKRHPVLIGLFILVGLLVAGGAITYFATDKGKTLLPTLEQPTLNISNITREKITDGGAVAQPCAHYP
jgi:hypothetical protein